MAEARASGERVGRFQAWLLGFTGALESGDDDALRRCFAVECSWQPAPFGATLRGRGAIAEHVAALRATRPGLDTTAEVLGVGATYGVARWTLTWGGRGDRERADGILLVALDPLGRCSAIREWTITDAGAGG
jgi:hypothetical protein